MGRFRLWGLKKGLGLVKLVESVVKVRVFRVDMFGFDGVVNMFFSYKFKVFSVFVFLEF